MPISRYPRRAHPLAPSLMAQFLQRKAPSVGLRLAELDATCWSRFGEAVCRRLAEAVVSHLAPQLDDIVRRLGSRRIAPAGSRLRRRDLDLEMRTYNCLERINVDKRPGGLADLTIREALEIRAFGIKSLVDLLTSVEAVVGNSEVDSDRSHAIDDQPADPLPHGICKIIRRSGYVPNSVADVKIPTPPAGTRLDDMGLRVRTLNALRRAGFAEDSTAIGKLTLRQALRIRGFGVESLCDWIDAVERSERSRFSLSPPRDFDSDESRVLLEAVGASSSPPDWVLSSRVPPLPCGIYLDELGLHRRTLNVLEREGFDIPRLTRTTIGELCRLRGFGKFCIVDLLQSIRRVREFQNFVKPSANSSFHSVNETIDAILAIPNVAHASAEDPRLGRLLRHVHAGIETVGQLVDYRTDLSVLGHADDIHKLHDAAVRCAKLTVESELLDILVSSNASCRNRKIVECYYGLGGGPLVTLEVLGKRYGITRERVRQICAPTEIAKLPSLPFAPALDAALALIRDTLPETSTNLQRALVEQGLFEEGTTIESIQRISHILGRKNEFQCIGTGAGQFVVHESQASLIPEVERMARKLVGRSGAAVIDDILEHCGISLPDDKATRLITVVAGSMKGFRWLDKTNGWFWFGGESGNRLCHRIRKALSVCHRIGVDALRAAIRRDYRMRGRVPPREILLEICRQMAEADVVGDEVIAAVMEEPLDLLRGDEARLVALLQEHGPICRVQELQTLALESGMSRASFWRCLQVCPTIARYGPCVYGLTGARIQPGEVEEIGGFRRTTRVIQDHGWTANGDIWIGYRISQAGIKSGVISVPVVKREFIQGKYSIRLSGHDEEMGTLTVKESNAWGLRPVLRRVGAENGDYFVIVFQLTTKVAVIAVGDEGVIEQFQNSS